MKPQVKDLLLQKKLVLETRIDVLRKQLRNESTRLSSPLQKSIQGSASSISKFEKLLEEAETDYNALLTQLPQDA
jgi:capsule polysaccharide export protein KpsE/RkpR